MNHIETGRLQQDQIYHLKLMDSGIIPRGAEVPASLLKCFLPYGSNVIEFGGGVGLKAANLLDGFTVHNTDINNPAMVTSRGLGIPSFVADVSKDVPIAGDVYDGGLMEGLLCNSIGENASGIVRNAWRILKPHGYLFIADMLAAEVENAELKNLMGTDQYRSWQEEWEKRYASNEMIGLPEHHFIVMGKKDGIGQQKELGTPGELQELLETNEIERFARHFSLDELADLRSIGFREIAFQKTIWFSRTKRALSGFITVWQKCLP